MASLKLLSQTSTQMSLVFRCISFLSDMIQNFKHSWIPFINLLFLVFKFCLFALMSSYSNTWYMYHLADKSWWMSFMPFYANIDPNWLYFSIPTFFNWLLSASDFGTWWLWLRWQSFNFASWRVNLRNVFIRKFPCMWETLTSNWHNLCLIDNPPLLSYLHVSNSENRKYRNKMGRSWVKFRPQVEANLICRYMTTAGKSRMAWMGVGHLNQFICYWIAYFDRPYKIIIKCLRRPFLTPVHTKKTLCISKYTDVLIFSSHVRNIYVALSNCTAKTRYWTFFGI